MPALEEVLIAIRGTSDDFQDAVSDARRALKDIPDTTTAEFTLATGRAEKQLQDIERRLDRLDASETDPEIQVNIGKAVADVAAMQAALATLPEEKTVDIDLKREVLSTLSQVGSGFSRLTSTLQGSEEGGKAFGAIALRIFFLIKGLAPLVASLSIVLMTALVPAILAVSASLASAVGGLGALATGLVGALGPIAAIGIAVFQRFSKVMEARKAQQQALDASNKDAAAGERAAAAAAEEHRREQEALRDAQQGVVTAQRSYAEAVRAAGDAIRTATQAQADAARDLTDANRNLRNVTVDAYRAMQDAAEAATDAVLGLRDAQLGLEEAKLSVREARQALRDFADDAGIAADALTDLFPKIGDVNVDSGRLASLLRQTANIGGLGEDKALEFERLALRYRRALLGEKQAADQVGDSRRDLTRARQEETRFAREGIAAYEPYRSAIASVASAERRLSDTTAELTRLQAAGVRGAPAVIAAAEGVRDAQERLAKAQRDVKAPSTTLDATASAAANARAKFDELTEAEKRFADGLTAAGTALRDFFKPITDQVFAGMTTALQSLPAMLAPLKGAFENLGSALGETFAAFGIALTDPQIISGLKAVTNGAADLVRTLGTDAFVSLFEIFLNLAEVALPLLNMVLAEAAGWLKGVADSTGDVSNTSGPINAMVESFRVWMGLIGAVIDLVIELIEAVAPFGDEIVQWITDAVKKFTEWLRSAEGQKKVKNFFKDTVPAVKGLITFIARLVQIFMTLIQVLGPAAAGFFDAINPVLGLFNFLLGLLLKIPGIVRFAIGAFAAFGFIGKVIGLIVKGLGLIPNVLSRFPGAIAKVGSFFRTVFMGVWNFISRLLGRIVNRLLSMPGAIAQAMGRVVAAIRRFINRAFNAALGIAQAIGRGLRQAVTFIGNLIRPIIDRARKIVQGILGVFRGIGSRLRTIFGAVVSVIKDVINSMIRLVNRAIEMINDIPDISTPLGDIGVPHIPPIPELAQGGIARSATLAMVGESGGEAVLPLTQKVFRSLGRAIANSMRMPSPAHFRGRFPSAAGAAAGGAGMVIQEQNITLPPAPEAAVADARHQAAQLAMELKRRGGR